MFPQKPYSSIISKQTGIEQGYLQLGVDEDLLVMGFLSAASAWLKIESRLPVLEHAHAREVILKDDIDRGRAMTDIWLTRAKDLSLIAAD